MFTEQLQEIVVVAHNSTGNDLGKVFEENGLQVLDIYFLRRCISKMLEALNDCF